MTNPRNQFRILIVEDTLEYAKLNIMLLERQGFEVHHACDGEHAISMLDSFKPDLMLLDLNLPMVSGWDVLKHLYSRYGEGSTHIIITSAYSDSANKLVGKLQEVDRYLVKPFTPQDLMRAVDTALGIS